MAVQSYQADEPDDWEGAGQEAGRVWSACEYRGRVKNGVLGIKSGEDQAGSGLDERVAMVLEFIP